MKKYNNLGVSHHTMLGSKQGSKEPTIFNNLYWLNTKDAAEYLRLSENALRLKVHRGMIKSYKLGEKSLRFKKQDLDQLMESSIKGDSK